MNSASGVSTPSLAGSQPDKVGFKVFTLATDQPGAARRYSADGYETYAILAKYTEVPIETMKLGLVHLDAEGRLLTGDVMHQIEWYKSQGMVKPETDGTKIIDKRYVVALPGT